MGLFRRSSRESQQSPAPAPSPSLSPSGTGYRCTVFFPDGSVVSDSTLQVAEADLPAVGAQGKIHQLVTIDGDEYLFDATARGGRVLLSLWGGDAIVTSAAVVSGTEPDDDPAILELFYTSTLGTDIVKHLTAGVTAPFAEMLSTEQRPFCATVLIPMASTEVTEAVLDWQNRWVGAHLAAVLAA